ncbi:uncharacterized protein LOC135194777 [Vanessa tameamea]|uniref:Uncharacterized protein LOC135194777 n=1 Tax=Vanessa tameamea TaxID=334116 RepID=A0ABM4AZC6_VANTA
MGITKFSDLTLEEFKQKYTGLKISNYTDKAKTITEGPKINLKLKDIPDSFDWRSKGMVSIVRNQGTCRSCWAFSTIGNVESAYAIKTQQSVILSEQQLVDCANDHCNGCAGGTLLNACEYLQSHGAMSEDSYSYIGRDGQCKYNPNNVKVKVNDCLSLKVSEDELAEKLVTIGPLSVGIDSEALQQYNGEPITEGCPGSTPDHAVLLVGYETDAVGNKYWLVKNSWGANWGDEGYFKMQRGVNCLNIMEIPAVTAIV